MVICKNKCYIVCFALIFSILIGTVGCAKNNNTSYTESTNSAKLDFFNSGVFNYNIIVPAASSDSEINMSGKSRRGFQLDMAN